MGRKTLCVIDDFYADAVAIRSVATRLRFETFADVNYPGGEARAPGVDWMPTWKALRAEIDEAVDGPNPKPNPFPQGLFRLALAEDEARRTDGVHQDIQRWSGVVYLSREQDCRGGVAFYRHRETGARRLSSEWEEAVFGEYLDRPLPELRKLVKAYFKDMSHWEEIQRVEMRFNRAVLLMAQCFHASVGLFGDSPATGRLTQHFEFYAEHPHEDPVTP